MQGTNPVLQAYAEAPNASLEEKQIIKSYFDIMHETAEYVQKSSTFHTFKDQRESASAFLPNGSLYYLQSGNLRSLSLPLGEMKMSDDGSMSGVYKNGIFRNEII